MSITKPRAKTQLASDLQKILRFQKQREWKQFHSPKNLAISLALESAEVLELFQWTFDNSLPSGKQKQLVEELADVYYYLLLLAHTSKIDLHKAFASKMIVNANKYPVHKSRGKSTKYTEL